MKLWVLSDLHTEFGEAFHPQEAPEGAGACVAAGDFTSDVRASVRLLSQVPLPVVFVPGNHEYYGQDMEERLAEAREAAAETGNVHLLDDDVAVIGGVRFIGSTLWTDFRLEGVRDLAMRHALSSMNDFRLISRRAGVRFTPAHSVSLHEKSRRFLSDVLRIPFGGPSVVVTHHCPHPGSVHPRYRGDLLNAAFTSDLTDVIEAGRPELWIHGHTHARMDYQVGVTRILCNPRGYPRENREFDPQLVVDAEEPVPAGDPEPSRGA